MSVAEASREINAGSDDEVRKRILAALGQSDWGSMAPSEPTEITTRQPISSDIIASVSPTLSAVVNPPAPAPLAPVASTTKDLLQTAGQLDTAPVSSGDQRQSALVSALSATAPALEDSYGASAAATAKAVAAPQPLALPQDFERTSYAPVGAAPLTPAPLALPQDFERTSYSPVDQLPDVRKALLVPTAQDFERTSYSPVLPPATGALAAPPDYGAPPLAQVRRGELVKLPDVNYPRPPGSEEPPVLPMGAPQAPGSPTGPTVLPLSPELLASVRVPEVRRAQPVLDDQGRIVMGAQAVRDAQGNIVMRAQSVEPGKIVMQPPVPKAYPNAQAGTPAALPVSRGGINVTRFGYAGDAQLDPNSAKGIGDRDNALTPNLSAALSVAARKQFLGVDSAKSTGKTFTYQGKTFRDDDTSPAGGANLDVFDPFYSGLDKGVSAETAAQRRAGMPAYAKAAGPQPAGPQPAGPRPTGPQPKGEGYFGDLSQGPPGAPPATGTKDSPYWPKSDKDVKLLPSGATYIDPNDRSIRTMPGQAQQPTQTAQAVTSFTNPNGTSSPTRVLAPNGQEPTAIIFHHTSGGGNPDGVRSTLKERNLGVQYIVDRDGNLVQGGGDFRSQVGKTSGPQGQGLGNNNTVGVEFIAKDNNDITPAQLETAKKIGAMYPNSKILGHGDVAPDRKEADEGLATKTAALAARGGASVPTTTAATTTTTTGQPTIGGKSLNDQVEALIGANNTVKMPKPEEIAKDDIFGQAKLQALRVAKQMQDAGIPVDREKLGALITSSFSALQSQQVEIEKEKRSAAQQVAVEAAKRQIPQNLSAADSMQLSDSESSLGMLDNMERLYEEARTKGHAGSVPVASISGLAPDAIAFDTARSGAMSPVAKGIFGNTGNLSEMEQQNALKNLPERGDSPPVFQAKMNNLRLLIANKQIERIEGFHRANIEMSGWTDLLKKSYDIRNSIIAKTQNAPGTDFQSQEAARQQKADELNKKQVPDRASSTTTTGSASTPAKAAPAKPTPPPERQLTPAETYSTLTSQNPNPPGIQGPLARFIQRIPKKLPPKGGGPSEEEQIRQAREAARGGWGGL